MKRGTDAKTLMGGILLALAATIFSSAAPAGDLGGDVGAFAKIFNDKARALKAGVLIAKGSCETEVRTACDYKLTDGVTIIAGSAANKKTLQDLTVHLLTDDRMVVLRYLAGVSVILRVYAPEASSDEVNSVLGNLVGQISRGEGAEAKLHGVNVNVVLAQPFGSFTSISRP